MIDAREAPNASRIEADVVIIGGGMAGATLAHELAGSHLRLAVLESGGLTPDPDVQEMYRGTAAMARPDGSSARVDEFMYDTRRRLLGGSGNVWGGRCLPLAPADFRRRRWIPNSGWPITYARLKPYYDRACDRFGVPRFAEDYGGGEPGRPAYPLEGFRPHPGFWSRCSGRRDRQLFDAFRMGYAAAPNVGVWLNANVREIVLDRASGRVSHLDVACLNGRRHEARGRVYILAAGGIENARLLLASNSVRPEGVANRNGLVGRFFQGHLAYFANGGKAKVTTSAVFTGPEDLSLYEEAAPGRLHCTFATTAELQARLRAAAFDLSVYRMRAAPGGPSNEAIARLAGLVDGGAADVARHHVIGVQAEQPPTPESRITLAGQSDALGMPRAHLDWVLPPSHWDTLDRSLAAFARAMGQAGRGRLCWPLERTGYGEVTLWARHHMGATRMHRDPEHGVVDAEGRAHDAPNLYIAGSSVFPTSGVANPTLTLAALAIRMADHLKRSVRP